MNKSLEMAQKHQKQNLGDLIKAYEGQPIASKEQQIAKDLTLSIAKGEYGEARTFLNYFKDFIEKEGF